MKITMEVLNGVMVFMMTINFWGGLLIVEEVNILMIGHQEGVTFMKLTKHYVERYFERVLEKALPNDRGPLDLAFLIDKHKAEIWKYKEKESEWIKTENLFKGSQKIIDELSAKLVQQVRIISDLNYQVTTLKKELADKNK